MSHKQFEIEVKVLLGNKKTVSRHLSKLKKTLPNLTFGGKTSQLNHYFISGNTEKLLSALSLLLEKRQLKELKKIFEQNFSYSLRTRWEHGETTFVLKTSTSGKDSVHDLRRREFEALLNMPIEKLDRIILSAGFSYQSKWSRQRQTYFYEDLTICIDKNAGYGYLAEFEKVVYNENEIESAKKQILDLVANLGLTELPNDRLNRMFSYYNTHWQEYYQTEKTFTVK